MGELSRRAQSLLDSPPLAPYILEHFTRVEGLWDPDLNPDGYIPLCIAENKRQTARLAAQLATYGTPPPRVFGYDQMTGNLEFRRSLAGFMGRTFLGRAVDPDAVAVLSGAGTVLEQLFFALADPGDGVLVPTPSYAGFWADLETRDELRVVPVHARRAEDFRLTTEALDEALERADRPVRALLYTNPNNPLGTVASREEVMTVRDWAVRRRIHVVFDEIYALSVFGETPFVSAASLSDALGPFVHIVWAFSKDFGASGLRCGVLVSENEALLRAVDQVAYWGAVSGHTQWLLSEFVSDTAAVDTYLREMRADLAATHALMSAGLTDIGVKHLPAQAAFFMVCDLREFLAEPTWEAERALWRRLVEHGNINLTPGEACRIVEPGFFRLCYAGLPNPALRVGLARLRRVLFPDR